MKKSYLKMLVVLMLVLGTNLIWAASANEKVVIKINISEMKFQIEGQEPNTPLRLKAGQDYKLIFENLGSIKHEILIGRGLENENAEEYSEKLFTNSEIAISGSVMVNGEKKVWVVETTKLDEIELDAGLRLALFFSLPENVKGVWEIGCFMPGHFQMGMRLPLIVE